MTRVTTDSPTPFQPLSDASRPHWAVTCLNCDAPLSGAFCGECGQRSAPPHPRVRELAGDALAELSGWDGKLAETLRLLVTKPGELTRQFIAGRRARFISPVRLYLTMSVVYFLLGSFLPSRVTVAVFDPSRNRTKSGTTVQNAPSGAPERLAAAASSSSVAPLTPAQRAALEADIRKAPPLIRPIFRRAVLDRAGLKRDMNEAAPRVLFGLLPVFAAILALFYRKRHYPEHLYFAFHFHTFVFLALSLVLLSRLARIPVLASVMSAVAMLWIASYAVLAMRRLYGGGLGATIAKGVGVAAVYLVAGFAALVGLLYWTSLFA